MQPYDVLFPGETVTICDPDNDAQTITVDEEQSRVALRVKIMDSGGKERRGWISAEEQEVQLGKQALGSCCCFKTKKKKMTTVNGIPLLPDEEPLLDKYDKDELPKKLTKSCIDPRSDKEKVKVRRKQQYAIADVGEDKKAPPQLAFTTKSTDTEPTAHLADIKANSTPFEAGRKLKIEKHVGITRGVFGDGLVEADAARNYAKGQPSSPADGKYLRWEWSLEGAESWTHFDEKSSQLLTDAKEGLEVHSQPNRDGFVELKENDGFKLAGLADEDYFFKPTHCEVSTQWKGVVHKLVNKQTKKPYDIRMIAVDIAYLSDAWNQLDFFVVITSWATVILEVAEVELPFKTSSLRALRVMRVLRSMRFFAGIKTILSVLGQSVGEMGNIVGFLLFVYCILGIVGVQMFRGRLMYRCSASFPEPDATGWKYEWMGIGDPNGPSDVFANSPYCYPGDSASSSPPWVDSCEFACTPDHADYRPPPVAVTPADTSWCTLTAADGATPGSCAEVDANQYTCAYDTAAESCTSTSVRNYYVLSSNNPNIPNTEWEPVRIFHRLDSGDSDSIGELSYEEVRDMLGFMGVGAPRDASDAAVDAASIQMRWQAPTCTGTATEVAATCTGTADRVILEQAQCTGTPDEAAKTCDLLATTDDTATCLEGCTYTPAETPICDLDATTPSALSDPAACPDGCHGTSAFVPQCDLLQSTDATGECPAGCDATSAESGTDTSIPITATLFEQWWNREYPCMPCYEAPSCRALPDDPDGAHHMCYNFGNPGFGAHGFDHIVMSWHTIFIMMTNLYWWETAYQLEDVQGGLGSAISWLFGLIVVFMLSWVTVNMFVAVICDTFSEVLEQQKKFDEPEEEEEEDESVAEDKVVRLGAGKISHTIFMRKQEDDDNDTDLHEKNKKEQQKKDKNRKKIHLQIEGKFNEDGSQWENEMLLKNPRPYYVDKFLCTGYRPVNPDDPESGGKGNGGRFSPTKMMLNPLFDNIIMCFILGNTVTLAMEHTTGPPVHLMSESLTTTLNMLGHVFNAVFIFEMTVKILGMGYLNYLAIPFNCLDHFIVGTSILNYFGDLLPGASAARLLRIFRLFRIAKVVRILYKYQSIKRLLDTVAGAGTMLANLTLFILFVVTVFAIMGMHLMGDNINTCSQPSGSLSTCQVDVLSFCEKAIDAGKATCAETYCSDPAICPQPHACDKTCNFPCFCEMMDGDDSNGEIQRRHYENIGKAWLMAFQTLTGDDWCNQMYAYVNIFGWPAAIFYAVVFIFNNYVLMNMFIAVILEGFAIENAAKEEKQVNESRAMRSEVITSEMFAKEEVIELPRRRCCFIPLGNANDVSLNCMHGKRRRYQTEGTPEYPDTIESADVTRSEASEPSGFQVRVKFIDKKDQKDERPQILYTERGPDRITYEAYIASEKRWNDPRVFVTKILKVKGAVQTVQKLTDGFKNEVRDDAELRAVCKMPVIEDLLDWVGAYKGSTTRRPVGYHHPDEPPAMDAATRTLWQAFDRVREEQGTIGQLMWEMGHKELTQEIVDKAVAAINAAKEEAKGGSPLADGTPMAGGATPGVAKQLKNSEGQLVVLKEPLVKALGFDSIKSWWFSKDESEEPTNPGGLQAMTTALENEKKNKKLLALRDEMITKDADKGLVPDAVEECKLQEGAGGAEIFEQSDADENGSLDQDEMKQMFVQEEIRITDADVASLFDKVDTNSNSAIDKKEFLEWLKSDDELAVDLRGRKLEHSVWTLPQSMELIKKIGQILLDIQRQDDALHEFREAQKERPTDAPEPPRSLWNDVLKEGRSKLPDLLLRTKNDLYLEEPRGADVVALMEAEEYSHPIRQCAERIAQNPWFERTVMIAIIISSVLLAMEGPQGSLRGLERVPADKDATNDVEDLLGIIDTCFYGVFLFEFFTKLIAYGFWTTPDAYIKDAWNKLDFVVVVFSTVNYLPGQSKSSLGRIFRLGRCLRPLRMINKFPSLQVIVAAIVDSLGTNTAVLGLSFMLFLIFGILGVNIFGGKFYHCTDGGVVGTERWDYLVMQRDDADYPVELYSDVFDTDRLTEIGLTQNSVLTWRDMQKYADVDGDEIWKEGVDRQLFCAGEECAYPYLHPTDPGLRETPKEVLMVEWDAMNDRMLCQAAGVVWQNKPWHFDDIVEAIMGMFTASTLAGWTDLMEMSMDVTDFDKQPVTNASAYFAVYWVLFVFLLAFFITNLFLGVLIDFIAEADGSALTTDDQQEWTDLQRNTKSAMPPIEVLRKPEHPIRLACYNLTADPRKSAAWTMLGNFAIGSNVIVMMLEFEGQTTAWEDALDDINLGFLIFFSVDMVLKFIGLGPGMYFLDPWNKFDAIVVSISWIGDIVGFKASVARAFRAFRIALVLKNAKGLQALFRTLINSVKPSVNICALLLLLFSLYAILGMQIFGGAPLYIHLHEFGQVQQNRQSNFHSYWEAMKLLFECSAGKDWKIVMYEVETETGSAVAFGYFFTFFFFAVYILTNMFVAVIIDEFGACQRESGLSISLDNMIVFQKVWRAHALIHESEHAIKIKGGKNKVNVRQILKDVGLFTGQEQQSEKLDREHREAMKKYDEATELSQKQSHFAKAEELLTQLRVVESDLFREGLTRQWDSAVRAKDFARADDTMQKLVKLDEDIHELKGNNLAPSCELVLKMGGTKEAVISQFVKKADERDLGTSREIIKKQDMAARDEGRNPREIINGVNVTPEDLKKFDSGTLVPHPEWINEEMTPEEEELPAVLSWKPGEVHPLWEEWFKGVQNELRERERLHPTFQEPFRKKMKRIMCGILGDDTLDQGEEDIEVHYLAVLEAVLLQSMRKAGNENPDKDKKLAMLKDETKRDVKRIKQRIKAIHDPYTGVPGKATGLMTASSVVTPSVIKALPPPDGSPTLPGQLNESPSKPQKGSVMLQDEPGVKVVVWEVSTNCESYLHEVSRKPEYKDDPDNMGRSEAATFAAAQKWQSRGLKVRAQPLDAAIEEAKAILNRAPEDKERPNFAKELSESGIARRIPGVPDACKYKVEQVASHVGTRMVLTLTCTPPDKDGKGGAEAVKGVNVADQCLFWCADKLPIHQVPAAVVVVERDDADPEPETTAASMSELFQESDFSYPWEMHSLLSANGWHLREANTSDPSDGFDYLDETEVMVLKEAWNMIDVFSRVEAAGEKSIKCREQTGWITTGEALVALKLSGLYIVPNEGTAEANEWEDRIWQPRGVHAKSRKSDVYELEDEAHDKAVPCHLGDIDRDMKGAVAIGWPEFLAIVGALQNPAKCRGGKVGLARIEVSR